MSTSSYDVVIVGGGHNALTSAAYLAREGVRVLVLERAGHTGGAAISTAPFPGQPTRLSRYSYLVSLLPERIRTDLGLDVELRSRPTASFTPYAQDGHPRGLLVQNPEGPQTRQAFVELTGSDDAYEAWQAFYREMEEFAKVVAPTFTEPLPRERSIRDLVDARIWEDVVEYPLAETIERRFSDDLVRGIVATDALIGTFASMDDPGLAQNRCFFYHLVGNGTGEWRVPVGGMGAVTDALARAARDAGAEVLTGATATAIYADDAGAEVVYDTSEGQSSVGARFVLSGVAPAVLAELLGEPGHDADAPEGSQLKINFLLDRLPRLASGVDPETAFAGTFHLNESYSQIAKAHDQASRGKIPKAMPGEVYCHSLTDPSILGDVPQGTHTLTYFGLHTPASLFRDSPEKARNKAVARALESINQHLAEPIEHCVATDADGALCIEAKTPVDIEADLKMPGGHIFHGDLEWPWAPNRARLDTPAASWGVETDISSVMLCGSGARRGGAVSGIGGHNAAQAVLQTLG